MRRSCITSLISLLTFAAIPTVAHSEVELKIYYVPPPPNPPGYAIYVDGQRVTHSEENVVFLDIECTGSTKIMIDPSDSRYSRPTQFCDPAGVSFDLNFHRYAAQLWDETTGQPKDKYAAAFGRSLRIGLAPSNIAADALKRPARARALHTALVDGDLLAIYALARTAKLEARLAGRNVLAEAYLSLERDALFRLEGVNPAKGEVLRVNDRGTIELTDFGQFIVNNTDFDPSTPLDITTFAEKFDRTEHAQVSSEDAVMQAAKELEILYTGAKVYKSNNEEIGQISDLTFSSDGKAASAVIDVGGFLGLGERSVAVPLEELTIQHPVRGATTRVFLDQSEGELTELPAYEP